MIDFLALKGYESIEINRHMKPMKPCRHSVYSQCKALKDDSFLYHDNRGSKKPDIHNSCSLCLVKIKLVAALEIKRGTGRSIFFV